ncbi:MAG: hypothetical protein NC400_06605 [Clostridium sp.]|nr:hypothetical protein [Clostridium sp.]
MKKAEKEPFDFQVRNLARQFYEDYPAQSYKELLRKSGRPYNCLLIQSHYGYFICIPYRSHINHKYAYKFRESVRSQKSKSGLDYSKIVIVSNGKYIGSESAVVDKDEFKETRNHIEYIKNDCQKYIDDYVSCMTGKSPGYDKKEFLRKYQYSTLKYFHRELGII